MGNLAPNPAKFTESHIKLNRGRLQSVVMSNSCKRGPARVSHCKWLTHMFPCILEHKNGGHKDTGQTGLPCLAMT